MIRLSNIFINNTSGKTIINPLFYLRSLRVQTQSNYMNRKRKLSNNSFDNIKMQKVPSLDTKNKSKTSNITSSNELTFDVPDKSYSDKKDYKIIRLLNKLTVLLVSDPTTSTCPDSEIISRRDSRSDCDSEVSEGVSEYSASDCETDNECEENEEEKLAAAALCVNVGSFSDPMDVQGLAHFLEHMIFMGSEKYPKENEFDSYIKNCGGSNNANTDCEETNFYLEIPEKHLEGALDRFAQLFTAPLLQRDAMTREREAIESEFFSKMQADDVRRDQLLAHLGNPNHPCSIFTWGNLKTLKDNVEDDILYQKVHDFRKRHYSGHRMYLCVQSARPLDELEQIVTKLFSDIPCNDLPSDDFSQFNEQNAFCSEFTNRIFFVKPVANVTKISFTWCLPTLLKDYKTKPHHYASYLFGYEGKGSLLSYLRKKLWGLELIAGIDESGFEHNSLYSLFVVTIYLTDEGLVNIKQIISATYSYVKLLCENGISETLFTELQSIEASTFKYSVEQDPIDNVENLVVNLKYYPPKHVLTGPELYFEYDSNAIKRILNALNTNKCNIMITSSKPYPGVIYNQTEKWFGTEFTSWSISKDWECLYNAAEKIPELHVPEPNKFVTTDFNILYPNLPIYYTEEPKTIFNNEICELWFKPDHKFGLPRAYIYFYLISPLIIKSARNTVLMNLYTIILKYHLVEELYPASVAGLSYQVYSANRGILIKISGYNQNLHLIADIITKQMKLFMQNVSEVQFSTLMHQLQKNYYNALIKPKTLNKEIRLAIVNEVYWTLNEKYNILSNIKLADVQLFANEFLKELKIQTLIQGNILKESAENIMRNVLDNLNCGKIIELDVIKPRTVQLPLGESYICVNSFNNDDVNTIITNFYQFGPSSVRVTSLLDLITMIIEEPLFDQLRTKEQLGYDVSTTVRDNNSILGYSITINSQEDKFTVDHVDLRIEEFRSTILKVMNNMTEEEFEKIRDSLIKLKQIVDNELKDEMERNWSEITSNECIFDRNKKEAECLKEISQKDVIDFYKEYSFNKNNYRKFSIQVKGNKNALSKTNVANNLENESGHSPPFEDKLRTAFNLEYVDMNLVSEKPDRQKKYILDVENFKKDLFVYPPTKTLLD